MFKKPVRTYFRQKDGRYWVLTLLAGNEGDELPLHIRWKDPLLQEWEGISINFLHRDILADTELMKQLATLPYDMTLEECERLLNGWGFTRDTRYGQRP